MAIQLTTANRDQIAIRVWGTIYSKLSQDVHRIALDGKPVEPGVPTSTPAGTAGSALTYVKQYAQFFTPFDGTTPDAWESWFIDECAYRLALIYKPDQAVQFRDMATRSMRAAMATLSSATPNSVTTIAPYTSINQARGEILDTCARLEPPVLPNVANLDSSLNVAMNHLWNCKDWVFRRQAVAGTINADGTVSWTGLLGTFDHVMTKYLYYSDTSAERVESIRPDQMARLLAQPNITNSRPSKFRMNRTGGTITWQFYPPPDKAYNIRAEVALKTPTLQTDATEVWGSLLPVEFKPILKRLATSDVLRNAGRTREANDLWTQAQFEIDTLGPQFESLGTPAADAAPGDSYGDIEAMRGYPNYLGGSL